jgi:nicotinamide riboside kinase
MLNLNKEGTPFARIVGGKYNNRLICMNDDKGFKQLKIANDAKIQLIPNPKTEREILYITGPSGSGKSTFTRKYIEQYKKTFKDNPIYLFSSLADDESLDEIEPKRVRLDTSIYEDPILIQDFSNSIVIFDDIDVISDKRIRDAVYSLLNQILEIGRHFKISCVVTNHLPSNRSDTRRILNEAHVFVYFPRSSSSKIKYVLTEYLGLDKNQISKFKKLNSRFIAIIKNYPGVYIAEHEVGLLHPEENEDNKKP